MSATRESLHLVAAHVLGRRRAEVSGRFGLRASPGGFAAPAFGDGADGPEVVRVDGTLLVVERGGASSTTPVAGASLRSLAAFVGTDVDLVFSVGADTPAIGDADAALVCDEAEAARIAWWFDLGWQVLDRAVAGRSEATTTQLWPEHFDAGCAVGQVNLGFSPGDGFEDAPYAYVGPWGEARPGPAEYWNAPFGAVLRSAEVLGSADPMALCLEFMGRGLTLLGVAS